MKNKNKNRSYLIFCCWRYHSKIITSCSLKEGVPAQVLSTVTRRCGIQWPKNCSPPFTMELQLLTGTRQARGRSWRLLRCFYVGDWLYAEPLCSSRWLVSIHATTAKDEGIKWCFMIPAINRQIKWKPVTAASKGKKPCVLLLDQQGAVVNKNSKMLFASQCISR